MCAEIDPVGCHRAILVAGQLQESGINVKHIVARKDSQTIETHRELENRLVRLYFKLPNLIGNELAIAYKKQNQKIGYKVNK